MTRVLYVAGWQRSGTTLLGDILGSFQGACHVGELTYLFTPKHPAGGICGCGKPISECTLWDEALARSGLTNEQNQANAARLASSRMRQVPRAIMAWRKTGERPVYSQFLDRIYTGISAASQDELIIDSSKTPGEALAAATTELVDAKVLHLVRDPRGCAYSTSMRAKQHRADSAQKMQTKSPQRSSTRWLEVNGLLEAIKSALPPTQRMTLKYEDFIQSPLESTEKIMRWVGLEPRSSPFTTNDSVTLRPSHTVMGNPNRFAGRKVALSLDEEWRRGMRRRDALIASLPAVPLTPFYGYELFPKTGN